MRQAVPTMRPLAAHFEQSMKKKVSHLLMKQRASAVLGIDERVVNFK